jgi:hypothetical protein
MAAQGVKHGRRLGAVAYGRRHGERIKMRKRQFVREKKEGL